MKAILYQKPHSVTVVHRSLRSLRDHEVLMKTDACGICGTDVHIVEGTSRSTPPVVLGHEYGGVVEDVGKAVVDMEIGQKVAVDPNIPCHCCYYCRRGLVHLCLDLRALGVDIDGGMAEYCIVPRSQLHAVPNDMNEVERAFVEPVSCAIHGIDRANIRVGDTVAVIGGGTIGLVMLQLAKNAGAAHVVLVEPVEFKRAIAERLGADVVLNPAEINIRDAVFDITKVGADVVIECVGKTDALRLAVTLVRRGGTIEFFGVCPIGESIPLVPHEVYYRELTIVGSYVNPHTFSRAIDILRSGGVRLDEFLIHRFSLDGFMEALRFQREGQTIKSLIIASS